MEFEEEENQSPELLKKYLAKEIEFYLAQNLS
jgi:hypothetical protein